MSHEDRVAEALAGDVDQVGQAPVDQVDGADVVDQVPTVPEWQRRIMQLFQPFPKTPDDFTGTKTAGLINTGWDKRFGTEDKAEEAQVGESIALCLEAVGFERGAGHWPPIAHLIWSIGRFFWMLRKKTDKRAEA